MSGLVANFRLALSSPLIHCSGHCLQHGLMKKGSACKIIKVLIVLQPEADSGKGGLCLAAGIACFTEVDVLWSISLLVVFSGVVINTLSLGQDLKKKKKSGLSDLL